MVCFPVVGRPELDPMSCTACFGEAALAPSAPGEHDATHATVHQCDSPSCAAIEPRASTLPSSLPAARPAIRQPAAPIAATGVAEDPLGGVHRCQALGPAAPCPICGIDCSRCDPRRRCAWESARLVAWQHYAQGEYVGMARLAHVPEYRLRVDDEIDLVFRLTREELSGPYRLEVGDEIRIESLADELLNRDLLIQPDGTITLPLLGQVRAKQYTVTQLRDRLDKLYEKYYKAPAITVTPLRVNTRLEDLRASIDRRAGIGGQSLLVRVTPEGTVALPALGSVPVQGLTLGELREEINERYRHEIAGMDVVPVLANRAPRYIFVLGEVGLPGRFELTGPTTMLQAISMAGSWNVGANLRQIVIFRRGENWQLMATMVNLFAALQGHQPCPPGEIWLNDSDVIIVPKSPILLADDFIELVFTRGIYGIFPLDATMNFSKLSTL
jgi:polysaccharide export outer membrane protein